MTATIERRLARLIGPGRPELSCEDCFTHIDHYIDQQLAGVDADGSLPGMAAHLAGCPACAEEHTALLAFLAADDPTAGAPK